MKKTFCTLLIVACSLAGFAQKPIQKSASLPLPTVDKRTELFSIIFRLAGNREYNNTAFPLYTDKIEAHFAPFKDHELIQLARKLKNENGVSYDAVMGLAVRFDDKLNLNKSAIDSTLDRRWDRAQLGQFASLLKKFVKDSRFNDFYRQNEVLYKQAALNFMPVYENIDVDWYRNFYGQQSDDIFRIILSMSNGGSNYGASVVDKNGVRNLYSVMGAWTTDSTGMVVYPSKNYFATLIHEFAHSFIEFNSDDFRTSGEKIFAAVREQMTAQAYGWWPTVIEEAAVRASVVKYMKDHNFPEGEINQEVLLQKARGFVWISGLVDQLDKYAAQRTEYPTFKSYTPKLVEAYVDFAQYTADYDSLFRPKVVSIDEFVNGDTTVCPDLRTITINFDRPLSGKGYSINYGQLGAKAFPKVKSIAYANDNRSVVVDVELQDDCQYQMVLTGKAFLTPSGDSMKPYEISFKTGK